MTKQTRKKLTNQGKLIIGAGITLFIALIAGGFYFLNQPQEKSNDVPVETVVPTQSPETNQTQSLAEKYDSIWEEYSTLNEDYIAYLEWENDLLYNYGEDTTDPYPHLIVRSRILDAGEGNVNVANSEYMRNDISHAQRSFGQDFMDGETTVDENYVPQDQNTIIYGHYVYPSKYGVDYLKFTPLHKFKDMENFEDYDTFTLTFNGQQRTYQVAHAFTYDKALFTNRQDSPLALNYSDEELAAYMDKIDTVYGDYLDTDVVIGPEDNFATLQTCVENRDDQLFFVIAKEINRVDF